MAKSLKNNDRVVPSGKTQVNFNIPNDLLEKVKDLAFWETTSQSEIYQKSVIKFLELWENKHGKIKDRPKGNGLDSL